VTLGAAWLVRDPPLDRMALLVDYLEPVVSEHVIVDTGSDERSIAVMESWGTTVLRREWRDDFGWARNQALPLSTDWTLIVDPDELPSLGMMEHLRTLDLAPPETLAYLYWTRNYWTGELGPAMEMHWHVRAFRSQVGRFYRPIHELVELRVGNRWMAEGVTRDTVVCPKAPKSAYLIHSKGDKAIARSDAQYAAMS
jgi:hypothetical protein